MSVCLWGTHTISSPAFSILTCFPSRGIIYKDFWNIRNFCHDHSKPVRRRKLNQLQQKTLKKHHTNYTPLCCKKLQRMSSKSASLLLRELEGIIQTKCSGWDPSNLWMRFSRMWMRSGRMWMRSSWVVRASDCQCQSRNPSIHGHNGIRAAADEAVLNKVLSKLDWLKYSTCFSVHSMCVD